MFERFTERARRVLVLAQEEARFLTHSFLGTEHLLLGLIHDDEGVAAKALEALGVSLEAARREVAEIVGTAETVGSASTGSPPFTPRAKKVLELALREALELAHGYIGTEHLLLGIVREGEGVGAAVLVNLGVDLAHVRQLVLEQLARPGRTSAWPAAATSVAVAGDKVKKADIPVAAGALLGWEDATGVLQVLPLLSDARTTRAERDGVTYETCTYYPLVPPEVAVSVAGAVVTREAFDAYTSDFLPDAEHLDGLADAATFSADRQSLRVLAGSTAFVVMVRGHPQPKKVAIAAARRALANLGRGR